MLICTDHTLTSVHEKSRVSIPLQKTDMHGFTLSQSKKEDVVFTHQLGNTYSNPASSSKKWSNITTLKGETTKKKPQLLHNLIVLLATFVFIVGYGTTAFGAANKNNTITVGAQTGTATYGTATSVTYTVTLACTGGNPGGTTTLSLTGTALPTGATAAWSNGTYTISGGDVALPGKSTSGTVILTITNAPTTPTGTTTGITITGTSNVTTSASFSYVVSNLAPTLTESETATVDAPFNVTFADDATWRAAITSITVEESTLAIEAYSVTAGEITFSPSASTLLQSSGSKSIVVFATGYNNDTVSQTIGAGAATKLGIGTQPTAAASSGGVLATQPIILIQDQYGNTTTSSASVTASLGAGSWTLGGTTPVTASSGTATFLDLTATYSEDVTGATITFTSSELTSVTSETFNLSLGNTYYLTTAGLSAMQIPANWNTIQEGGGTAASNFTTSGEIFIIGSSQTASCGGALTISSGVTLQIDGILNMGTNQLLGAGTITNNGTLKTASTANPPIPNSKTWSGTVEYANTSGFISGGTYNNLTSSNTSGSTPQATGDISVTGTLTTAAGGTIVMSTYELAAATVSCSGNITTSCTSSTPLPSGKTWGGVVAYASSEQTLVGGTYSTLDFNAGSGTLTASGNVIVNTDLTNNGITIDMSIYQLSGAGSFTNNDIIRTACTANPPIPTGKTWGGTVYYDNATGYLSPGTYGTLKLTDASGTLEVSGGNLSTNILEIPANGILDMGTNVISNLGTITGMVGTIRTANTSTAPIPYRSGGWPAGSTIEYYGSTKQYINAAVRFDNLIISNTAGVDVTKEQVENTGTLTVNPGGILNLLLLPASTTAQWWCYGDVINNGTIYTPTSTPVDANNDPKFRVMNGLGGTSPHIIGGNGMYGNLQVWGEASAISAEIIDDINVTGRLWSHNSTVTIGNADDSDLTITADSVFVTSESSGTSVINVGAYTNTHTIICKNLSVGVDGSSSIDLYNSPTQVCNVTIAFDDNNGERIFTGLSQEYNNLTLTNAYGTARTINMWERPSAITTTIYGDLTLGTNTTIRIDDNDLDVRGDITNNGRLEATTGIVKLKNTAPSTGVHTVSGSGYFKNVQLDDSYGATLASDIAIEGAFTLTTGIFNTSSYFVDLGTTGTISEGASPTAPTSYVTGTVKATRTLIQNVANTFGGLGLEITETNKTNNVTNITRVTGTSAFPQSVKRKFTISPADDESLNGTLKFYYFDHEIVGTEANYKHYKSTGTWAEQASSVVDEVNNKVTLSNITDFSDWTVSDEEVPLPIELISLTAKSKQIGSLIEWETASEQNNDYFTLFRSKDDGINFIPIAQIQGAGTTSFSNNYSYLDESECYGIVYYKLAQTDYDGTTTYSQIVSTQSENSNFEILKYMNKSPSDCVFEILLSEDAENNITITNMIGVVMYQEIFRKTSFERLELQLPPGVYTLINITKNSIHKERFMVK